MPTNEWQSVSQLIRVYDCPVLLGAPRNIRFLAFPYPFLLAICGASLETVLEKTIRVRHAHTLLRVRQSRTQVPPVHCTPVLLGTTFRTPRTLPLHRVGFGSNSPWYPTPHIYPISKFLTHLNTSHLPALEEAQKTLSPPSSLEPRKPRRYTKCGQIFNAVLGLPPCASIMWVILIFRTTAAAHYQPHPSLVGLDLSARDKNVTIVIHDVLHPMFYFSTRI